mmetsp:Transcript_13841/g.22821  ORF Transcript_13841/g.22821 Transcript_13841/m.22821 type:complete len:113 (+) Transcript_13841:46-384(+)
MTRSGSASRSSSRATKTLQTFEDTLRLNSSGYFNPKVLREQRWHGCPACRIVPPWVPRRAGVDLHWQDDVAASALATGLPRHYVAAWIVEGCLSDLNGQCRSLDPQQHLPSK